MSTSKTFGIDTQMDRMCEIRNFIKTEKCLLSRHFELIFKNQHQRLENPILNEARNRNEVNPDRSGISGSGSTFKNGIASVPTFIDGKEISQHQGLTSPSRCFLVHLGDNVSNWDSSNIRQ